MSEQGFQKSGLFEKNFRQNHGPARAEADDAALMLSRGRKGEALRE